MSMAELIAVNKFIWFFGTVAGMSFANVYRWAGLVADEKLKMFFNTREYICVYFYDLNYNQPFSNNSLYLYFSEKKDLLQF